MSRTSRGNIIQLLGINSKTERSLDTRTESLGVSLETSKHNSNPPVSNRMLTEREDTSVIDFSLDKCSLVEITEIKA